MVGSSSRRVLLVNYFTVTNTSFRVNFNGLLFFGLLFENGLCEYLFSLLATYPNYTAAGL